MRYEVIQGNVFDVLPTLEPGSMDICVTSPPYWQLRSYLPKGHALKPLELGSEKTPAEFIDNMVRVFALVRDALAEHGMCWINIGDTYSQPQAGRRRNGSGPIASACKKAAEYPGDNLDLTIPAGNLCLIPQRMALALQADGWLVRSVVIWQKPSAMPQSVSGWAWRKCRVKSGTVETTHEGGAPTGWRSNGNPDKMARGDNKKGSPDRLLAAWSDCPGCPKCTPNGGYVLRRGSWRPTSSYEPVLMLAKSDRYFGDGEPVKTPPASATLQRASQNDGNPVWNGETDRGFPGSEQTMDPDALFGIDGANLRDVWRIAAEPLREKHYAAFPTELVLTCLKAGVSAKGYCPTCGGPWCRVLERDFDEAEADAIKSRRKTHKAHGDRHDPEERKINGTDYSNLVQHRMLGWRPSCTCPPHEPRPGRVLDPFAGSGRTLRAARALGLDSVGIELNPEYVAMARRLVRDDAPLFESLALTTEAPNDDDGT